MRAGGFTVQQALTAEAATVIKQAVTLARRRGHAQVTPLHVASTMLSSSTGLLRTACLQSQSHSHPLQCKALELCFNVALNRLPASSSSPMLSLPHSHHPSISNALVAAFKRAQAHQRRGSIENQQQPLLAVKIELEQLIISILDDPSVSRVMREAGFSSTLVKTNVEQTVSLELCSQTPESSNKSSNENNNNLVVLSHHESATGAKVGKRGSQDQVRDEDVTSVIENLMNKTRKSLVIVGENVVNINSIVRAVKEKVDQGDVPEALREMKFISIPLFSFENLSRGKVEKKLEDLMRNMKSFVDKGLILYLGDLNWITEYRLSSNEAQNCYCPVEHMISELGRLAYGIGESGKFWFMGIASFQTYMKCKTAGYPSLESAWRLHPLTVPAGALAFSLIPADSNVQKDCESKKSENGCRWLLSEGGEEKQLTCCADCTTQFEIEAARNSRNTTCHSESTSSTLPSWLRDERKRLNSHDQDSAAASSSVKELCKKWNMYCSSFHKQLNYSYNEKTLTCSSATSPNSSSTSCFSYDRQNPNFQHFTRKMWPVFEPKQSPFTDHEYWNSASNKAKNDCDPILTMCIPENIRFSNPNSTPNSASSSDVMEMVYVTRFKEFNTKNLNTICNALEKKVPWQKDIIHEIAGTILQCRSGMIRRKEKRCVDDAKEETWFFFQGVDAHAKEKVARELARVVFGSSHSNFVTITLSSFSSTRADSTEYLRNYKRSRDEQSCSYIEKFVEALSLNPHRVFFIEDVEQADYCSQMGMKRAIESGRIRNSSGEEVSLGDSIIILSCESFSSRSRVCSPPIKKNTNYDSEVQTAMSPCMSLDLNMSFGDDDVDDESTATDHMSIDDIGLLESVDRLIVFKIQEL